jgi:[acyl-carrier-protein] S-malonyltransferase
MTKHHSPLAFIFPGQGSQAVGMGKELSGTYPVARQTFEEADAALGYKLSQLCFEGPEDQLRLTEITQPAILTVSVAAARFAIAGIHARLRRWTQPWRILGARCSRHPPF